MDDFTIWLVSNRLALAYDNDSIDPLQSNALYSELRVNLEDGKE